MANNGFSKPVNYWGTIAGLSPKSSQDGKTSQVAEAQDEYGDTAAHDVYGETIAPSVEYAVVAAIEADSPLIALGDVVTYGDGASAKNLMVTSVSVGTQAGSPPTVTIAGVEVESGATAKRTYPVNVAISPRSRAQDVVGAFTASSKFTQIGTTFSVDPHVQTITGVPVASDASHGRIEVQVTMTDPDGNGSISVADNSGFAITAAQSESDPDAGYQTKTATATKFMDGTEADEEEDED